MMSRTVRAKATSKGYVLLIDDTPKETVGVGGKQWQLDMFLKDTFRKKGYKVLVADSLQKTRKHLKNQNLQLVLLDGDLSKTGKFKNDFKEVREVKGKVLLEFQGADVGKHLLPKRLKCIGLSKNPRKTQGDVKGHSLGYLTNCVAVIAKQELMERQLDFLANLGVSIIENIKNKGVRISWDSQSNQVELSDQEGRRLARISVNSRSSFYCPEGPKNLGDIIRELLLQVGVPRTYPSTLISKTKSLRNAMNADVAKQTNGQVWGFIRTAEGKQSQLVAFGDAASGPANEYRSASACGQNDVCSHLVSMQSTIRAIEDRLAKLESVKSKSDEIAVKKERIERLCVLKEQRAQDREVRRISDLWREKKRERGKRGDAV